MRKISLVTFLTVVWILIVIGAQAIISYRKIQNHGRIVSINLDTDQNSINWGTITPNETKTHVIQVKIHGNVPTNLTMYTENWVPRNASLFMELSWNYTCEMLDPNMWYPLELSLYVLPSISGIEHFSFDIVLIASDD